MLNKHLLVCTVAKLMVLEYLSPSKILIKNPKKQRKVEADKRKANLSIKGDKIIIIIVKINGIIVVSIVKTIEDKNKIIKKFIILTRKRKVFLLKAAPLPQDQVQSPVILHLEHNYMIIY